MPYSYECDAYGGVTLYDKDTGEDVYMQGDDAESFLNSIGGDCDGYYDEDALEDIAPEYFGE